MSKKSTTMSMEENRSKAEKKSEKCAIYGSHAEVKAKINSFQTRRSRRASKKNDKKVSMRESQYTPI